MTPGRGPLALALGALTAALAATAAPWAVIGGVAAAARGARRRPRAIAVLVRGDQVTLPALVRRLAAHRITGRIARAAAFAARSHVLLARHAPSGVAIDLVLAWTALEHAAIAAATPVAPDAQRVPVAQARDLVVLQIVAGARADIDDASALIAADRRFDRAALRATVAALAEAADEPRFHATLARVLEQVRVIRKLAPR